MTHALDKNRKGNLVINLWDRWACGDYIYLIKGSFFNNLRCCILQGMLVSNSDTIVNTHLLVSLWKHETTRVIADRFTSQADKDWFEKTIKQVLYNRNMISRATFSIFFGLRFVRCIEIVPYKKKSYHFCFYLIFPSDIIPKQEIFFTASVEFQSKKSSTRKWNWPHILFLPCWNPLTKEYTESCLAVQLCAILGEDIEWIGRPRIGLRCLSALEAGLLNF